MFFLVHFGVFMWNAHTESGTFTFVINFASLHKLLNDVECTLHPFLAWSGLDFLIKAHRDAAPSKGRLARRADKVLATHFALVSMELSSSNQVRSKCDLIRTLPSAFTAQANQYVMPLSLMP